MARVDPSRTLAANKRSEGTTVRIANLVRRRRRSNRAAGDGAGRFAWLAGDTSAPADLGVSGAGR
jgi:hypothetical protein